jgi:hypothetical protein
MSVVGVNDAASEFAARLGGQQVAVKGERFFSDHVVITEFGTLSLLNIDIAHYKNTKFNVTSIKFAVIRAFYLRLEFLAEIFLRDIFEK